jgi:hypothetical protein
VRTTPSIVALAAFTTLVLWAQVALGPHEIARGAVLFTAALLASTAVSRGLLFRRGPDRDR